MSNNLPQNSQRSDYELIGAYTTLSNLRVYTVGSPEAERGIVLITEGLSPQRLQDANMLAQSTNALVLVPDYSNCEALGPDVFPPDTEEKRARFHTFISTQASLQDNAGITNGVLSAAKAKNPTVESWGVFGLCSCLKVPAPFNLDRTARTGYMIPLIPSCITSVLDPTRGQQ
ncbi:hypothetical protein BDV96DRAFT_648024 [Lophiotrema nucula]|uniref:Dienelactone hydrolase domain-containing protein n=1 Tax=Lophiotrema nucula TaxID=690887 RepID=A0A6A5Z2Y9_9PLEO|nr:hypothetical protein BDV96DRAFT_648024 [Lophiotrema nucula]